MKTLSVSWQSCRQWFVKQPDQFMRVLAHKSLRCDCEVVVEAALGQSPNLFSSSSILKISLLKSEVMNSSVQYYS